MVKYVNKYFVILLTFLLLLMVVPSSFANDIDNSDTLASDNGDVQIADADNSIISNNEEIQVSNVESSGVIYESNGNTSDVLSGVNDIYFNSSASRDGDGTIDNPYKYLYPSRLTSGSTAHFADGNYTLDSKKGIYSNINIIGQSSEKTIINFNYKSNPTLESANYGFDVGTGYTLTLSDLTLNRFTIRDFGTVIATNVIFENGVAPSTDSYNNAYGGAIYLSPDNNYYTPRATLTNCTFLNNSAMYGGAIYVGAGIVSVSKSKFINNTAHWFGGAIASELESALTVSESSFINCTSLDDAGGAIYAFNTDLEVKDSNFTNCSANFAGAICSLNLDLLIDNVNFINNLARYEGGAIYKMYGSLTVKRSNFNGNAALNGGALFSDNCTYFDIINTEFESNEATGFGGAIFSNANPRFTVESVTFTNNKASYNNNILNQSNFSPIVSADKEYPLFVYKSEFNGTLPARYNLAEHGYVTSVKDQQSSGNCWAFATIASLETCVLKSSNKTMDFSMENMKNIIEKYSAFGWNMETNEGGYNEMGVGYLASWLGPVNLTSDPFDDMGTLSPVLDSEIHVQNIYMLPARTSYTDNDAIKEAILKYGGLYASYYHSRYYLNGVSYYCPTSTRGNHAICVVGWDDNYSRNKFSSRPAGDGAFIVKNSWGESWGDNGYFYISYYDKVLFKVGSKDEGFTFILNDTVRYNKNYQYDVIGMTDYFLTGKNTIWYQNIYNATGNELIAAFSTYFNTTADYEVSVYVNGNLKLTQSGNHEGSGYYTIPLKEYVPVSLGDEFKISVKLSNPKAGSAVFAVSEMTSSSASGVRCYYAPGVSYFSTDGKKWNDLYDYKFSYGSHTYASQVACLKAFTISTRSNTTIILNDITSKADELTEIIASVTDSNGAPVKSGDVLFNISGEEFLVNITNGIAKINFTFNSGTYNISVSYLNNSVYNPSEFFESVEIAKNDVNLTLDINNIVYGENLVVNVNLTSLSGKNLSGRVVLRIDNKNYDIEVINGSSIFTVDDILDVGQYLASVSYLNDRNYNDAVTNTTFVISKKEIAMNVTLDKNYKDLTLNVILSEEINGTLTVLLNKEVYLINYTNGVAEYTFNNLSYGNYTVNVTFTKDSYESNSVVEEITITPAATVLEADNITMYYQNGTRFEAVLKDFNGVLLINQSVVISINGNNYTKVTDGDGKVSIAINLVSGVYNVTTVYNGSQDYLKTSINNTVNVLSTIIGKDVVKYYRNATQYYATVLDKQGNPIADGNVTFNINGVFYNRTADSNGRVKLNINLNPGEYIITVFNLASKEQTSNHITVLSKIIENHDLVKYYKNESAFSVKIIDNQGIPIEGTIVTFNVNGVFYYKETDSQGVATLAINLRPGNYIITTIHAQYAIANNITVLPTLETDDLEMEYKDGSSFNATILDGQGKPAANKNVTFNVNGVFYNRESDANGVASLNINLMKGEYIITSQYDGLEIGNTIKIK